MPKDTMNEWLSDICLGSAPYPEICVEGTHELNEKSQQLRQVRRFVNNDPQAKYKTMRSKTKLPNSPWIRQCYDVLRHIAHMEWAASGLQFQWDHYNAPAWWQDY